MQPRSRPLLVLVAVSGMAAAWQIAYYVPRDLEVTNTKQYLGVTTLGNYGGYGMDLLDRGGSYELVHHEAASNYENARRFLTQEAVGYTREGHVASFDRLASPFLASVLVRASFGALNLRQAFVLLNALLWVASLCLAAGISWRLWQSSPAVLGAMAVLGAYPVFPMLLTSVKVQHGATLYVLAGLYIFLTFREKPPPSWFRTLSYSTLLYLGFFFSGGIVPFVLFLGGWLVVSRGRADVREAVTIAGAFVLAAVSLRLTDQFYEFTFVSEAYELDRILQSTYSWVHHAVAGGDVSDQWFLNYAGMTFWDRVVRATHMRLSGRIRC